MVGSAAGFTSFPACSRMRRSQRGGQQELAPRRGTRNAAATAVFTSAISNESPYTPVTVAMRDSGMLSICVVPSRSQGNPVM